MIGFLSIHHNGQELDSVDYERLNILEVFLRTLLPPNLAQIRRPPVTRKTPGCQKIRHPPPFGIDAKGGRNLGTVSGGTKPSHVTLFSL